MKRKTRNRIDRLDSAFEALIEHLDEQDNELDANFLSELEQIQDQLYLAINTYNHTLPNPVR